MNQKKASSLLRAVATIAAVFFGAWRGDVRAAVAPVEAVRSTTGAAETLALLRQGEQIAGESQRRLGDARLLISGGALSSDHGGHVDSAALSIEKAGVDFSNGSFCSSAEALARVATSLRERAGLIAREPIPIAEPGREDAGLDDRADLPWATVHRAVSLAARAAEGDARHARAVCDALAAPLRLDAVRIVAIDDARRSLVVEGMEDVSIWVSAAARERLQSSRQARLSGRWTTDGVAIVLDAEPVSAAIETWLDALAPALGGDCIEPLIVPIQSATSSPPVLHRFIGYQRPGIDDNHPPRLLLEEGMRIAAGSSGWCDLPPGPSHVVLEEALRVGYRAFLSTGIHVDVTMASELRPGDEPVAIWSADVPDREIWTQSRKRACALTAAGKLCGTWSDGIRTFHGVDVSRAGGHCSASFAGAPVYVDPAYMTAITSISEVMTDVSGAQGIQADPLPGASFFADGLEQAGGGWAAGLIGQDEPFLATWSPPIWSDAALWKSMGTNRSIGLSWPRVEGMRNASPVRWACRLDGSIPGLGPDLLFACGDLPGTHYRLPFSGGSPDWWGGAPHWSGPGSNQQHALDLGAAAGTPILAARAGVVDAVYEDEWRNHPLNDPSPAFMANYVAVTHEDGSVGWYFHMPQNGVSVNEGDVIARGALLGWVGNTGNSSGPHLHLHESGALDPNAASGPFRFEAASVRDGGVGPWSGVRECWVPQNGDQYLSSQ